MLGLTRGKIIVFNVSRMENFIARYDVMKSDVLMVRQVYNAGMYLAYDAMHQLSLFELMDKGVKYCHSVLLFRPLLDIKVNHRLIYLGFESGDIELWNLYLTKVDAKHHETIKQRAKETRPLDGYDIPKSVVWKLKRTQHIKPGLNMVRITVSKSFDHYAQLTAMA